MRRGALAVILISALLVTGCAPAVSEGGGEQPEPKATAAAPQTPETEAATQTAEPPVDFPELRESIEELREINEDIVGYLKIDGTVIDYPVVQGADNSYYLTHAYDGSESARGAVFWDASLPGGLLTQHIVLHAHNNKDGSMFSDLELFKDETFFEEHRYIDLETSYYNTRWEIISVYLSDSGETLPLSFADEEAFLTYAEEVASRSLFTFEGEITGDALLITLNTCSYEFSGAHTLICARLVEIL